MGEMTLIRVPPASVGAVRSEERPSRVRSVPTRYPDIEPDEHGMPDVGDGQSLYWEVCGNPSGSGR